MFGISNSNDNYLMELITGNVLGPRPMLVALGGRTRGEGAYIHTYVHTFIHSSMDQSKEFVR